MRLNLGPKIAFAVCGVLVLTTTTLAVVAVSDVARLGAFLEAAHQDSFVPYQQAEEIDDALLRTEVALLSAMRAAPSHRSADRAEIDRQRRKIIAALGKYTTHRTRTSQPEVEALLDEYAPRDRQERSMDALRVLHSRLTEMNAVVDSVWQLAADGQAGAAHAIYDEHAAPLFDRALDAAVTLMASELDESRDASSAGRAVVRHTQRSIALTIQVTLVIALAVIIWLTGHITRPLKALILGTRAVGRGDLSQSVSVTTRDEIGVLAAAFNQMTAQLGRSQRDVLAARDRATQASHAKSEFLTHMSHELRTPLGSIIGFANVMLKNKRGNLQPADLEYLGRMHTSGKHLLGLINEILDLAKLESGKATFHLAPVDVGALIREVAQLLEGQAMTKPVSLVVDVPAAPVVVDLDAENLKRVLINLAGNALKFTAAGTVTLRFAYSVDEGYAHIEVVDTGVGIPADRLDTIFEAFEQADASIKKSHGGTGLGLSISRSLCAAMGCSLSVESTVGVGSTFRVVLPAASPAEGQLVAREAASRSAP
jgi:signal transduction histidine kinase